MVTLFANRYAFCKLFAPSAMRRTFRKLQTSRKTPSHSQNAKPFANRLPPVVY